MLFSNMWRLMTFQWSAILSDMGLAGNCTKNLRCRIMAVLGKGPDGIGLFQGIKAIELQRGDEAVIDIEMETCEEGC